MFTLFRKNFVKHRLPIGGTSLSHEPTRIDLILVLGSSSASLVSFLVVLFLITSSIILVGGIVSGGAWYLSRTAMGPTSA